MPSDGIMKKVIEKFIALEKDIVEPLLSS